MDTLDRPDINLYSRIISNDMHQARVLAARTAAGHPSAVQWWHNADNVQRKTLATYCPEFARLIGGKRGLVDHQHQLPSYPRLLHCLRLQQRHEGRVLDAGTRDYQQDRQKNSHRVLGANQANV